MRPGSAICLSNSARPEVSRLCPEIGGACAAPERGAAGEGRPGRPASPGAPHPRPFNKSSDSQKSLYTFAHFPSGAPAKGDGSGSLAVATQPPAEGVAGARQSSCVDWSEGVA